MIIPITTLFIAYADISGIYLGSDVNGVNILNDRLLPFTEYSFPILVSLDGNKPMNLTDEDMEKMDINIRTLYGRKAIDNAKITSKDGLCYATIKTSCANYINECPVRLRVNIKTETENITATPRTKVGFNTASDSDIFNLSYGKAINVNPLAPIYRKSQLKKICDTNDNENVIFRGDGWSYENNITNLNSLNMYYSYESIEGISQKYPDLELIFLSFPAENDFKTNGILTIDVGDKGISIDNSCYLYRYLDGVIYPLKFDYNDELQQVILTPKTLGKYIISNTKLD